MVKAIVDISSDANRVLMIVKAAYGLKDKSQAIDVMAEEYEKLVFEPKVKKSFIRKLKKMQQGKKIALGDAEGFARHYGLR